MAKDGTTRARILVVDDDEVIRELLPVLLGLRPDEIQVAHSGDEAVAWLKDSRCPEVILTDLQMPGLERDALISALRECTSSQTLLLGMSGSQPPPATARLLDAFVLKPFGATELEHAIGRARRARRSGSSRPARRSPGARAFDRAGRECRRSLPRSLASPCRVPRERGPDHRPIRAGRC